METMVFRFAAIPLVLLYYVKFSDAAMRCLVSRPGYGLVSEDCPAGTVGCRIRVESDEAIGFYAYSLLYDRNQFVCVMHNEMYGREDRPAGCTRKKYGGVRCWCYGQTDCNTVEEGRRLYEEFLIEEQSSEKKSTTRLQSSLLPKSQLSTKAIPNSDTETSTSSSLSSILNISSLLNRNTTESTTLISAMTKPTSIDIITTTILLKSYDTQDTVSSEYDMNTISTTVTSTNSPTVTTQPTVTVHRQRPHKQKHRKHKHRPANTIVNETPEVSPIVAELDAHRRRVAPQSMRSEFDAEQGVHVIHVNARDQYDQLIASPEFAGILSQYVNSDDSGGHVELSKLAAAPLRNMPSHSWNHRDYQYHEDLADSNENLLTFSGAAQRRRAPSADDKDRARNRYYYGSVADRNNGESSQDDVSFEMRPLSNVEMARNAQSIDGRAEPRRRHGAVRKPPAGSKTGLGPKTEFGGLDEFFDEEFLSAVGRPTFSSFILIVLLVIIVIHLECLLK